MDSLQCYNSNSSSSSEDECLTEREFRSVYLVTYSQADVAKFPTRKVFARAIVESFSTGTAKVVQWVCCQEKHRKGGYHYHLAIKLDRNQRWMMSKRHLQRTCGITVHYSSRHHNYYSAWLYVTKSDREFKESSGHPDLRNRGEPRTEEASRRRTQSARRAEDTEQGEDGDESQSNSDSETDGNKSNNPRKRRLSAFEVSEIVVEKQIRSVTELHALAREQKSLGKTDLAEFILNRVPRVVSDIVKTAWDMEHAEATLQRSRKSRMLLLEEAGESDCVDGCDGQWRLCAQEILEENDIGVELFRTAVNELLLRGRGKNRNLLLTGPTNCGKSFLLNPLKVIYRTFCNPATGTFAWVGVENAECILLNDFRWSAQIIPWHDLLLMLEGDVVHLPAPKTHYSTDICLQKDTPIFATGKGPLIYVKNGVIDQQETDMMSSRWRILKLHRQIPREAQREIPPCQRCFCQLIVGRT